MPPRVRLRPPQPLFLLRKHNGEQIAQQCRCASVAAATVPAPSAEALSPVTPIQRFPATQPPSYKRPEFRKTQLLRQYLSLLQSTPLLLFFQHNNLTATELMALRRELAAAMRRVDEAEGTAYAPSIKLGVVQTGILAAALRVIESGFFAEAHSSTPPPAHHATDPRSASSAALPNATPAASDPIFAHGLSTAAHQWAKRMRRRPMQLRPVLSGPLLLVPLPAMSPAHLKTVLSLLAPSPEFPAPRRRALPSYHEPAVQNGVQKLMLLAARAEDRVFDFEGARWIGGIEGGMDGLRARLVGLLQGGAASVTGTLEAAGRSLYVTMEGRKNQLEEEARPKEDGATAS